MSGALGNISTALAVRLLNHAFVPGMPMTVPTALYAALFTSTVGAGVEVSATDYQRLPASFAAAGGAPVVVANPAPLQWAPAQTAWGTLVAGGVFDALAGGNFYGWSNILGPDGVTPTTIPVTPGLIVLIPSRMLVVGIT